MFPIIILAGGLATRLRPITEKIPKSLIEINGKPFVCHQLDLLEQKGFNKIHFCLGFLGDQVEKAVRESEYFKRLSISFSYDGDTLLGTGGTIKNIINQLPKYFFVTYGDSYLDIDFHNIQEVFKSKIQDYSSLMTVYKNTDLYDNSNVIFENDLIELYSKVKKDSRMAHIDYGVGILSSKSVDIYDKNIIFDLAELYESLSLKKELYGYEVFHRFYEIGSLEGIEDLSNYLKLKNIK
jgi:MurNAc alpha-1-phosphate uridylyltransferase